MTGHLN